MTGGDDLASDRRSVKRIPSSDAVAMQHSKGALAKGHTLRRLVYGLAAAVYWRRISGLVTRTTSLAVTVSRRSSWFVAVLGQAPDCSGRGWPPIGQARLSAPECELRTALTPKWGS